MPKVPFASSPSGPGAPCPTPWPWRPDARQPCRAASPRLGATGLVEQWGATADHRVGQLHRAAIPRAVDSVGRRARRDARRRPADRQAAARCARRYLTIPSVTPPLTAERVTPAPARALWHGSSAPKSAPALPVGRIASELGYARASAFTAMVRRTAGEPPSRFSGRGGAAYRIEDVSWICPAAVPGISTGVTREDRQPRLPLPANRSHLC